MGSKPPAGRQARATYLAGYLVGHFTSRRQAVASDRPERTDEPGETGSGVASLQGAASSPGGASARGAQPPRPRRPARIVATGVLLALLLWFAFANLRGVPVHFWVVTRTAPLIVVVAISGVLGAAVSKLWSRARRRRAQRAR